MTVIYSAIFFEECFPHSLEKGIDNPHVTHRFRPKENLDLSLLGREVSVKIVGYGNDGENEGYLVELLDAPFEVDTPHITIGISLTGKPVNTKFLDFSPCEERILIGKYGFFTPQGVVVTE